MRFKSINYYFYVQKRCKATSKQYSHTVLLPKTSYPIQFDRQSRIKLDEKLHKTLDFDEIYRRQLRKNENGKPLYVIHDGPPYANGDVHVGHAVNKIFKDIVLRYKAMTGHRVHFRPGWDCHGLPIELKCVKNNDYSMQPLEIRRLCKKFALETIDKQMASFKRWGCLGDWSNRYATMDNDYEAKELEIFMNLFKSGLIYRSFMPVHWSPSSRTALAEAELEYNSKHKSLSTYCRFLTINFPRERFSRLEHGAKVYAIVWTTTPWTLPLNDAICYSEKEVYCLLGSKIKEFHDEFYLVAEKTLPNIFSDLADKELHVLDKFASATTLRGVFYVNPVRRDVANPFLAADHVDSTTGTGLVHCSFAHGIDDFAVAERYGKHVDCYVDESGRYSRDLDTNLAGKNIFTDGLQAVLKLYRPNLMSTKHIVHSYPYDWRTKEPTIVRVSRQWFIDSARLASAAEESLKNVAIFGRDTWSMMSKMMSDRRRWCISRQRSWGVPIPALYLDDDAERTPIVDELFVDHLKKLFIERGSDCWWALNVDDLVTDEMKKRLNVDADRKLMKGDDILDIWFDSGVSWATVLPANRQADLIVEGIDQFRGWFQSLLLTSIACDRGSPYQNVLVHGFALDEKEQKMSKSLGNVVDPKDITEDRLGVDGLRYWVANQGGGHDKIIIGPTILAEIEQRLKQIRKTFKFLLGNLHDFAPSSQSVPYDRLTAVDKYVLHALALFETSTRREYDAFKFNKILFSTEKFTQETLSAFYFTPAKDRLYCDSSNSTSRRAAQTVLHAVGQVFTSCLAPILPHFAEEAASYAPETKLGDAFDRGWVKCPTEWTNAPFVDVIEHAIIPLRTKFFLQFGAKLPAKLHLTLEAPFGLYEDLKRFQNEETSSNSELIEFFRVSMLTLTTSDTSECKVSAKDSSFGCCLRCRLYVCSDGNHLCERCVPLVDDVESRQQSSI